MRTIARLAVTAGLVLAGVGLTAGAAGAAPAGAPEAAAPAVAEHAAGVAAPASSPAAARAGWFYYATYNNHTTCNTAGLIIVANGWARGATCYARGGGLYDLYLLL